LLLVGSVLTIPAGQASVDVDVIVLDDAISEPTETVSLTLLADASYVVGSSGSRAVLVTDNDEPLAIDVDTAGLRWDPATRLLEVDVLVSGGAPVTGFQLNAQLADGLAGIPEPVFQAIDFTGGIWDAYAATVIGGPLAGADQYAQAGITFNGADDDVAAAGRIATLIIDWTGFSTTESFALRLAGTDIGVDSYLLDPDGQPLAAGMASSWTLTPPAEARVVGHHVFYNNSSLDGQNPAANIDDDDAIDPTKRPLLPGQTSGPANITSYSRGINGLMIDIADPAGVPGPSDFEFAVGTTGNPATWVPAPAPSITVRPGNGDGNSDRVMITWPDGLVSNTWLQVTVKATAATGLTEDSVFYLANVPGDADGTGSVDLDDFVALKHHFGQSDVATAGGDFDLNGHVDLDDFVALKYNFGASLPDLSPSYPTGNTIDLLATSAAPTDTMHREAQGSSMDMMSLPARTHRRFRLNRRGRARFHLPHPEAKDVLHLLRPIGVV
jgi:hypothetical protein